MEKAATIRKGEWNLSHLVEGKEDLDAKLVNLEQLIKHAEETKAILNPDISSEAFNGVLRKFDAMISAKAVLGSYSSLRYAEDTQSDENSALDLRMERICADADKRTVFFDVWWEKTLDEKNAARLMEGAGDFAYVLEHDRKTSSHLLSEAEEKVIATMNPTGISAIVKLYETITNGFEYTFNVEGKPKKITREELKKFFKSDKAEERKKAYTVMLGKYKKNIKILGEIYQNRVMNWQDMEVGLRRHSSPISVRNVDNDIDEKAVDALLNTCRRNANVFREFFELKAKEVGMRKLSRYDIYMPVKEPDEKISYSYENAQKMVLGALGNFSPTMMSHAKEIFTEGHVDHGIRKGKASGAFCMGVIPSLTPYLQITFNGTLEDVFTLAHEAGHGTHYSAASAHSATTISAPLTLAETASTFSESLLFESIADKLDRNALKSLTFDRVDDFYATIMRQTFFTVFEIGAHDKIAEGDAVTADINKIYMGTLKEQFGDSVEVPRQFEVEWSAIPHIYFAPFYCYAYSFGEILGLSLFQRYKNEDKSVASDYEAILAAGGSQNPQKLLSDHGVDATSERFWQGGFDYIKEQMRELKRM
jgi:oligoendopeptidase F